SSTPDLSTLSLHDALPISGFLKEMLQSVDPSIARGQDATMLRAILDRTAERLGHKLTNQPEIEADLRGLLGRVYLEIGDFDRARSEEHTSELQSRSDLVCR